MIRNIIFDLSEVIISGYHGVEIVIEQNTNVSAECFLKRKKDTIEFFLDTMRGKHTEDEYLEYLIKDTSWNIDKDTLKRLIRKNLNIPVEGTMDIIKNLSDKYNLILLSDHVKEWVEYMYSDNLDLSIFKHKYFSYDCKKIKSDEGVFKYIINDQKINPEETIFIDDYESNVKVANEAGIRGIVFKDANQLKNELEKFAEMK